MLDKIKFSLLRGICQMPAYVAYEKGFFKEEGLAVILTIEPTAWMVPHKLASRESQFAVIPWTRVAAAEEKDVPLMLICGSGFEEAAIVVRKGINPADVKRVAVPLRGGIKDLTAMGLLESLGWRGIETIRLPSGDGAILSFVGMGADAASMVEPYATMMEGLGIGTVIKRTGDIWQGAPGCSLTTTVEMKEAYPEIVQSMVRGFVRGAIYVRENPQESSDIASQYIGINSRFIRKALEVNLPDVNAIRNRKAMDAILSLMITLGYISKYPLHFIDLSFLDRYSETMG
jgi:NitT/TauT family transport system substrate-binding protein